MVSCQGVSSGGLSSVGSLQVGLLPGWFHQVVCHQYGLLSGWSLVSMVSHWGGLDIAVIRVVSSQVGGFSRGVFHHCGLLLG